MRTVLLVAAAAAALGGCVSSGGADTVVAMSSDLAAAGYVQEVALAGPPAVGSPSPAFEQLFEERVAAKLKTCATGATTPLRLDVTLAEFKRANAAATMLVGSSNMIKGSAKLVDPVSGKVVGDYDVTRSVGAGGLLGIAAMSQAEEQMSDAFADEVCKRAFVRR